MKTFGTFAFAAALLLGASSAGLAGDGYPNTNYPYAYGQDSAAATQAPVVRRPAVRATDAFAWERNRPSFQQEQRQQDRQTDNVNNN